MHGQIVAVIPAIDEAANIGRVVDELRDTRIERVIVVDGGSHDGTPDFARQAGADVVIEPEKGYGRACLAGIRAADDADVVVFLDGDGSDDGAAADLLVDPIVSGAADVVLGARHVSRAEPGAIAPAARFGNALASLLIRRLYGATVTDLAPFKAVRGEALRSIAFRQLTYGWTTELTVASARRGLRIIEVPVRYRRRGGGQSKVSGTIKGSVLAGACILSSVIAPTAMQRLLIMAKAPVPGVAKTRLAADLGDEPAATLAAAFLADTYTLAQGLDGVQTGFFCPAGAHRALLQTRFPTALIESQRSSGLAAGLEEAFARSASLGFAATVLVDGDSPTLPAARLAKAFAALKTHDLVLGPTLDGGYYLIGARRAVPDGLLSLDVPSGQVFATTIGRAREAGFRVAELEPWYDVDTVADLERLRADLAGNTTLAPRTAAALAGLRTGARVS